MTTFIINRKSATNGASWPTIINGRPHVVTTAVAIVGDSVMNRIFFPMAQVEAAAPKLILKPVPASHPKINGKDASAANPLSYNAHNIGAFVFDSKHEGDRTIATIAIDVEVAEKDERGREALKRISNNEKIAFSTGLVWDCYDAPPDSMHNGESYDFVVARIEYDHLALLLDELPGGKECYSITNSQKKKVHTMELEALLNKIIANSKTTLFASDLEKLTKCNEADAAEMIVNSVRAKITSQEVDAFLNSSEMRQINAKDYEAYMTNKEEFEKFMEKKNKEKKEKKEKIIKNSKLTEQQLASFTDEALDSLLETLETAAASAPQPYIANSAHAAIKTSMPATPVIEQRADY